MFVPEVVQKSVLKQVDILEHHEFDVRADAARDEKSAQEINNQGGVKRLPRVFEDNVVYDGRTGALAESEAVNIEGNKPSEILVDVIKGEYKKFSKQKQFEVMAASLGENLPDAKVGYRRYAGEEDITFTIRQGIIHSDASLSVVIRLLSAEGVPVGRIKRLYDAAFKAVTTQRVNGVVNYVKKHNCTPAEATKDLGYPLQVLKAVEKSADGYKGPKGANGASTGGYLKKQPLLDSALRGIKRYADKIIDDHRASKVSGSVAINVAKAHAITAEKIKRCADEAFIRVTKDVQSISLGTHRY